MGFLTLAGATPPENLNLDTGMPLYILLPLIIVIAIAAVVGVRWLYKKMNKIKDAK